MNRLVPALIVLALAFALAVPAAASADVTADFEGFAPGTEITNQYADLGGQGLGVTFAPLPGGVGDGFHPVVLAPPAGQANSGTHVGDISVCNNDPECIRAEFFTVGTTGTFQSGRKHVSVRVGINGPPNSCTAEPSTCADVTLKAYNANGAVVGTPATTHVEAGEGFKKLLSVDVPAGTIRGFSVDGSNNDINEQIAIDDVSFDVPTTPPPPDFTVTPASTFLVTRQGGSLTDKIAIARTAGSQGNIRFALSGTLPRGVHASFAPNPAGGDSTDLTVTADPDSGVTGFNPITLNVTATPQAGTAGRQARSFPIQLQVRSGIDVSLPGPSDVDLSSSCVAKVPIQVTRDFGITGPVSLSVTGATGGVQTRFEPDQITFPGGSAAETTQLVVTGPATGQDVPPQTLTVHASAPPLADRTVQVTVHGACPAQYDARVTGIEITQGAQTQALAQRDPAHPTSPTRYADLPDTAELRSGGPTVVRVYANLAFGPMGGAPNVPVLLYGAHYDRFGQQKAIAGGPLSPVSGTRNLDVGPEQTPDSERGSETAAYSFVLPPDWTNQKLAIGANLQPSAGGGPLAVQPCDTQPCKDNDNMSLTQIPFTNARKANIWPLEVTAGGVSQPDPSEVFKWARMTAPIDVTVKPYVGTIDVTDVSDKFTKCNAAATTGDAFRKCNDDANNAVGDRVQDYACDHGSDELNWLIGVNTGVARGLKQKDWCWSEYTTRESAVVERKRPTTSVAHEFGHLMGRPHADTACGGEGESWPPDNKGFLQSNGLATTQGTGVSGGPFAVMTPPKQWFDFMSYCANSNNIANPAFGDSWISVRGWNDVFNQYAYRKPLARPVHLAQGTPRRSLRVSAVAAPSGVSILSVEPLDAPPMPASQSAYHLVAFDAAGKQVADTPMIETGIHVDGEAPSSSLDAVVPVEGVSRVAIVRDGATVAERAASGAAPEVTDVRVPTFGRTGTTLRWRATDADGGDLDTTITYSADGGRSFHPVWTGPNRGVARVPARALPRSSRARLRVTVNDGFREASAQSAQFRAPGAAPVAKIASPLSGLRQPNDAPLALAGQATDDRSRALTGRRLRWLLGGRVIGTGEQVSPAGLPPGRHRIVLEARDRTGRVGRDAVVVTLTGARPLFLALKVPARVSAKARAVHIRVAASLPARMSVSGPGVRRQRFAVDRHHRTVTVRIRRGTNPLNLRFALRSGPATNAQTLTLARR